MKNPGSGSLVPLFKVFQVCSVAAGLINEGNNLFFSSVATLIRPACRKKAGTPSAPLQYFYTTWGRLSRLYILLAYNNIFYVESIREIMIGNNMNYI